MELNKKDVNITICELLGLDPKEVINIDIHLESKTIPKIVITKSLNIAVSDYLQLLRQTSEYRTVQQDPRNIILMEEMKDFFNDKLSKTRSFDEAFTKAIWKAYLKGIDVGSKNP